jgi:hypothetical protein
LQQRVEFPGTLDRAFNPYRRLMNLQSSARSARNSENKFFDRAMVWSAIINAGLRPYRSGAVFFLDNSDSPKSSAVGPLKVP